MIEPDQFKSDSEESEDNKTKTPWPYRKPFDPIDHELDPDFRLTKFSNYDGCLEGASEVGMNIGTSITLLGSDNQSLIQTTDFIYPVCDNPYLMGRIACVNVLSDLYATGMDECDNMLTIFAISNEMSSSESSEVVPIIMRGFEECASEVGSRVTGGRTKLNPWLMIGGVATTVCDNNDIVPREKAEAGDVLVLTKPLGTLVAVTMHQWLDDPERWDLIKDCITEADVRKAHDRAVDVMCWLNRVACRIMRRYDVHAVTNIKDRGLLGQLENLAILQANRVSFVIDTLPIIRNMNACPGTFKLWQGNLREVSGGLLICLPSANAQGFCSKIREMDGHPAWIVGKVEKGNYTARIIDEPNVIQVPDKETEGELLW